MSIEDKVKATAKNIESKAREALDEITDNPEGKAQRKPKINSKITIKHRQSSAKYFIEKLSDKISIQMMLILGSEFMMGAPETELDSQDSERPQHKVTVPTFFMGKYPVTQEQWQTIMRNNPSEFKGDKRPVERVSWNDAKEFCQRLSQNTKRKYRLPTEAEWEYACRAGTTTPFHFGETMSTDLANYRGTDWQIDDKVYPGNYSKGNKGIYREQTTPVGQFPPNNFGLCDMHGNVWEWCEDDWHDNYQGAPSDGSAWLSNLDRKKVRRGGSWHVNPCNCRSAIRTYTENFPYEFAATVFFGFRIVM